MKLPARKWRNLISQAWHADPLQCQEYQNQMRLISIINDPAVVEKILRHLNLWCGPAHFAPARSPPSADLPQPDSEPDLSIDPDPWPDYKGVISD